MGRFTISEQQETQATPIQDRGHYRRHRGACPFYRENWSAESDPNTPSDQVLYQIICLWDTPPVTSEEQQRCLHAANGCWRANHPANRQERRNGHKPACSENADEHDAPIAKASQEECVEEGGNRRNGRSKAVRKEEQPQEA